MIKFHTLDVFTDTAFAGNPLAVVQDAGALTTAQMQTIAREFNLSETIFVMPPKNPAHTARVRIFFPTAEIPFAGHPTLGCAIHLAETAHPTGDFSATITLEEEAGLVPVSVTRKGKDIRAELTAPVLPFPAGKVPEDALLAAALGLEARDLGPHRPGTFEGGPRFLFVPVRDLLALGRARPVQPHWDAAIAIAGVDSAYLYTPVPDAAFQARFFSPTAGIPEDPAAGSATAILAAQLLANGALSEGTVHLTLRQGVEMGRLSTLHLTIEVANRALTCVKVAGSSVRISQGMLRLP